MDRECCLSATLASTSRWKRVTFSACWKLTPALEVVELKDIRRQTVAEYNQAIREMAAGHTPGRDRTGCRIWAGSRKPGRVTWKKPPRPLP